MHASTHEALDLSRYLEVSTEQYEACLDCLDEEENLDAPEATLRFQHLRFDENGEPKFNDLAEVLADHIIEYCFAARRRGKPVKPYQYSRLNREGRAYLRKFETSGEAGEMLLYFLLEAVLKAPQMVAKMELKTNPKMESHGSDGIHMRWHEADGKLDIFFGEAKLEKTIYSALDNTIESLESFHSERLLEHEFGVVTSHYKHAMRRCARRSSGCWTGNVRAEIAGSTTRVWSATTGTRIRSSTCWRQRGSPRAFVSVT